MQTHTPLILSTPAPARGAETRRAIFLAHDGIVLSCALRALDEVGLLAPPPAAEHTVAELCPGLSGRGFGSLRVVLRALAGQGWLETAPGGTPATTVLRWTEAGRAAARHHSDYIDIGAFLCSFTGTALDAWERPWTPDARRRFGSLAQRALHRWAAADLPEDLRCTVLGHLDGALAAPLLLSGGAVEHPAEATEVLRRGGWDAAETARYAETFGMSGSYLPMFARLPDLIRGTVAIGPGDGGEWHVNRALNVNASAAAHARYFQDTLAGVLDLFDREPLAGQPRFIADVGCGNGRWLVELYQAVRERTRRGAALREHPLVMVGIDANQTALDEARRLLAAEGVPAVLLIGDISTPADIARDLAELGIDMEQGLHIRSFIDHDRTYLGGRNEPGPGEDGGVAFLDRDGYALAETALEADLVAHLRRWAPFVRRHGLVVLEAHSIAPHVSRNHLGAMHGVAFEAYHGLSHQYPIDHARWLRCCRAAGLEPVPYESRRYPATKPFVAVSLNRLLPAADRTPAGVASPGDAGRGEAVHAEAGQGDADGDALHRLLYEDGDVARPRAWCADATGWVVGQCVRALEQRIDAARPGDVLRVLDYGAGTGLVVIELLKAIGERRVARRLADAGVRLELHLVDLPTPWFDQGRRLLGGHRWVKFHDLRDGGGRFRPLTEVLAGRAVDIVLASMVFHLIPAKALPAVVNDFAAVLKPRGLLLWSSPDIGPAGTDAYLFHDVNRAVRSALFGAHLDDALPAAVRQAVEVVRAGQSTDADLRAGRRILPRPHHLPDLAAVLETRFTSDTWRANFEILPEELLDTLLVPSNAREFLPEIADDRTGAAVITALVAAVLPGLRAGPGSTARGLSIRWAFGRAER
jgi:SAM-dependent methyltransferase